MFLHEIDLDRKLLTPAPVGSADLSKKFLNENLQCVRIPPSKILV